MVSKSQLPRKIYDSSGQNQKLIASVSSHNAEINPAVKVIALLKPARHNRLNESYYSVSSVVTVSCRDLLFL